VEDGRMKGSFLKGTHTSVLISLVFTPLVSASVMKLTSPSAFSESATVLNFDDGVHLQVADTLYLDMGVSFSRDDGHSVVVSQCENDRNTTSLPNVLATIGAPFPPHPAPTWTDNLTATFTVPVQEVGTYFGNDHPNGNFTRITMTAYGENRTLLGSVYVYTNRNTHVDQFIGISSDKPIYSVRFQNNDSWYAVEIDDLMFTQIPEPTTLVLVVFGAVLAMMRQRAGGYF